MKAMRMLLAAFLFYTILRIPGFRVTQDPLSVRAEIEETVKSRKA